MTAPRRRVEDLLTLVERAIRARRPTIAVVDELAHTNAPGSRSIVSFSDEERGS